MKNNPKDKKTTKSPLSSANKTQKKFIVVKGEEKKTPKINTQNPIQIPNQNNNLNIKTKVALNNEKELKEQLDDTIKLNMNKEVNLKETEDKIKKSIQKQSELKEQINIANKMLKKQDAILQLYKKNDQINKSKIKDFEEKIKNINSQIEKLKEGKDKTNENVNEINKGKKDLELVSGAIYKLGEIFWESKTENYVIKSENSFLIKQKIKQYNGDF